MTEIDLSNYPDITDYNATINKSITIKDNKTKNLEGATLKVVTDGVMLSGIKSASVTTQSSLKISGSSLSSLSIASVSSASASQISGRGVSDNAVNPPTVEITGDNIPSSTDKITVTGSGELTQIDMTKQDGFNLVALTPMSSIKTLIKKGDSIDFSDVVMLGTYMTTSRMKVFRANLTEDYTETFSKLEKNFTVKIGNDEVFKNGAATNFDWSSLEPTAEGQEYTATISLDSAADCPFTFKIAVLPETITQIPEYVLSSIEVDYENAKTEYKDGDTLDLRRLIVWGTYTASDSLSYKGLVTDYTLNPPNGTVLTTANTSVSVSAGNCPSQSVPITVKPIWTVTIVKDASDDVNGTIVQKVVQGEKANKPDDDPTKIGYTFDGWYEKTGETIADETYDFNKTVSGNITIVAKWTEDPNYTVIFNANGGTGTMANQKIYCGEEVTLANSFLKEGGYSFYRWYDRRLGGGNSYDDNATVTDLTGDGGTIMLYAIWKYTKNGYNSYIDESGDIVINETKYGYTSFAQVMDSTADIIGSDENWSGYLDSSASGEYKGAFISGRNVKLSPYSMAQYLVTQELYEAVMGSGRNYDKNSTDEGKLPAYYVSWYDAITFCNKLSLLMGKEPCYTVSGITDWAALAYSSIPTSTDNTWNAAVCDITKSGYRLPTEAEWEFAARGGDQSKADWKYAFSGIQSLKQVYRGTTESDTDYGGTGKNLQKDDNLATVGWYTKNSSSKAHPVGGKTANRLGLSDMSGNLMEWCWDLYNGTVTSNDSEWIVDEVVTNPRGAGSGSNRCLRGGYWYNDACFCSVSYRSSGSNPYSRNYYIGFRLVCSAE